MEKLKEAKEAKQAIDELKRINHTLEDILKLMKKPGNKFTQALELGSTSVGILGIIAVIDIVIRWILGG